MNGDRRAFRRAWRDDDRQRFADGDRLKASTVPGRRPLPPAVADWLDELDHQADDELEPPAYVNVSVEFGGDTALEHLDRTVRIDERVARQIAAALGVDRHRLTLLISVDS